MGSRKPFEAIEDSYLALLRDSGECFLSELEVLALAYRVLTSPRGLRQNLAKPSTIPMPHKTSYSSKIHSKKAERARQLLRTGGVARDDSDDELGLEDHPWEWIYDENDQGDAEDEAIVGARMGNFECKIGDCVLLKAEGAGEAWIGLICDFQDDEDGEKAANFMWFSTEREIRNKEKKRKDFLPVGSKLYLLLWR